MPELPQDLPEHARERLVEMTGGHGHQPLFTSDLTVNEFLLVTQAGFEPLGMVIGCSIYHIGYQQSRWSQNEEMKVLSQAMYHARELAMTRMQEEAQALGADGIIGVRLRVKTLEFGDHLAEFVAIGTAVRSTHAQLNFKTKDHKPFTSDLSGQDFWTLLQSGYRPLGLVMGTCVYHVAHQSFGQWFRTATQNTEMTNFTQALYDARELAMERMQHEAEQLGARGIVGVVLHEGSHRWSSHVMEFFAVGTAIAPMRENHRVPAPHLTLSLND